MTDEQLDKLCEVITHIGMQIFIGLLFVGCMAHHA